MGIINNITEALSHVSDKGAGLKAGGKLEPGGELRAMNGMFVFRVQKDGNLVIYSRDNAVVWASGTQGRAVASLRLQDDGNLVAYGPNNEVVWAANEHGGKFGPQHGGGGLVMQADGNLVVYDGKGAAIWASNTNKPPPKHEESKGSGFLDFISGQLEVLSMT